jgi:CRP-like cAMP-binding protein
MSLEAGTDRTMTATREASFSPKAFLAKVGEGRSIGTYRKGQIVFSQGDSADAVFYVQKGKVKVTVVSDQGKEAVVAILDADEFFGEACLAGQAQRISTVAAMTEAVIVRLEKAVIVRMIHEDPAFSEMFMAHLLGRTIRVEADLIDLLFNSSEKRLARLLLLLANFGKEANPEPIIAKISQETLAEMIGTTRSRVSYFMNKFRKLGFVKYNGGIEVHRSLLNAVLHDRPQSRASPDFSHKKRFGAPNQPQAIRRLVMDRQRDHAGFRPRPPGHGAQSDGTVQFCSDVWQNDI